MTPTKTKLESNGWYSVCSICGLDSGPWRSRRIASWSSLKHLKAWHQMTLRLRFSGVYGRLRATHRIKRGKLLI